MEIIPAIMPKTYADIEARVEKVRDMVSAVQIDIMDGIFVPEKSWPFINDKKETLPYASDLLYSADLMIDNGKERVHEWKERGFAQIIVHIGSTEDIGGIIQKAREQKLEIGIAIMADTPEDSLSPWVKEVDFIQCMGIARIGYQGQPFHKEIISIVKDLRKKYPNSVLQVDGGVNLETALELAEAGANRLVVGSALWENENPRGELEKLQSIYV